jgi:hypothetical protein
MTVDTAIDTVAQEIQGTVIFLADRLPDLLLAAIVVFAAFRIVDQLEPYVYSVANAMDESVTGELTTDLLPDQGLAPVAFGAVKALLVLYGGLIATRIIGFSVLERELDRIVFYLPDLFGGLLILLVTLAVARVAGRRVAGGELSSELGYATEVALASKVVIVLVGVPVGLEMIGADLQLVYLLADGFAGSVGIGLTAAIAIVVGVVAGVALRDSTLFGGTSTD